MQIRKFGLLGLVLLLSNACVTTNNASSGQTGSSKYPVGPQGAPLDAALLTSSDASDGMSDLARVEALTRSQRVIYGSHYLDFYATLQSKALKDVPPEYLAPGRTCFSVRIETDDSRVQASLRWNAFLKRVGYVPVAVNFVTFVRVPTQSYPLVFSAMACADYVIDPNVPVYLLVLPDFRRGIDPIRLEWNIKTNAND